MIQVIVFFTENTKSHYGRIHQKANSQRGHELENVSVKRILINIM